MKERYCEGISLRICWENINNIRYARMTPPFMKARRTEDLNNDESERE